MYSCQNLIDLAPGRLGDMEVHSNGDAGAQAARAIPPSKMRGPSKMLSVCNLQSFGTWQQRWDKAHASIPVILGRAGPDLGCSPSFYSLLPLAILKLGVLDPRHAPWTCRCPSFWRALWAACVRGKWSTGRPLEHRELVTEAWEPLVCVELTYLSRCPLSGSLEVPRVAVPGRPNGSHQPSEFMNYNWDSGFGWALGGWFLRAFSLVKNQRTRAPKFFGTDTGH